MNRRHALKLGAGTALGASLVPGLTGAQETTEETTQEETTQAGTTTAGAAVPESAFLAPLSGNQEVPPVNTPASGSASFAYDPERSALVYALLVSEIENVTQAHIHVGVPGENGEVVAWLYPGPEEQSPQLIEGRFDGLLQRGEITGDQLVGPLGGEPIGALLSLMVDGETYVNVHTEQNPPGEIRGRIVAVGEVESALGLDGAGATVTETAETEEETPEPATEATTESG